MSKSSQIHTLFDNAIDAIISGNVKVLRNILLYNPQIVHQVSSAEHQASLLHYVSANGVEHDKQKTPDNILEIAQVLLDAGADPNKISNIYGWWYR